MLRRRRRVFGTFFRPPCLPPRTNARREKEPRRRRVLLLNLCQALPTHCTHTYPPSARGSGAKKKRELASEQKLSSQRPTAAAEDERGGGGGGGCLQTLLLRPSSNPFPLSRRRGYSPTRSARVQPCRTRTEEKAALEAGERPQASFPPILPSRRRGRKQEARIYNTSLALLRFPPPPPPPPPPQGGKTEWKKAEAAGFSSKA